MNTEEKLTLLEKQMQDLIMRVNKLEYEAMRNPVAPRFTPGTLPEVTITEASINPPTEASWPFPHGVRP